MTLSLVIPHFSLAIVSGCFSQFARKLQNPFDLLFILGHFFKAVMAWKPYGYYIESFLGTYIC